MRQLSCVFALVFALPLWAAVPEAEVAACRAAPTSDCLADTGYTLALADETLDAHVSVVDYLGQMGRLEEAEELARRIADIEGHVGARAEQMVGLRVAPYRMIDAFMAGADLAEVKAGPNGFLAETALMRMAGVMQSGSFLRLDRPVDPDVATAIRAALSGSSGSWMDQTIAADILFSAGEEAAALAIMSTLAVDATGRTSISKPMAQRLGAERVWEMYQAMERISVWWLADLVELADDPEQARFFLEQMYALALQAETPHRRAYDLVWVIRAAVKLGHEDIAADAMERQRDAIHPAAPEALALVNSHLAFGSPEAELREVLRRVERQLATHEAEVARSNIVNTLAGAYAEIGDAKRAARLLEREEGDASDWAAIALRDIDAGTRAQLLRQAERHLSKALWSDLQARMVSALARPEHPGAERDWARQTALALLEVDPPSGKYEAGYFYDRLLNAALRLGSPELRDAALQRSAETALSKGEAAPILQAAYQYHRLFPEAAR